MKYKVALAMLCGAGTASLLVLLLNIPLLALPLSLLLMPGALPVSFLVKSEGFGPPLGVLAANAVVYAGIAFAVIFYGYRAISSEERLRFAVGVSVVPALLLIGLACVPAFNPLWPQGMVELASQERELQQQLPLGIELQQARALLRSKGIPFYEQEEKFQNVVLEREETRLVASPGDRTISSRLPTEAGQFPCGYDMQIILLFGQDEKLKEQYIHRFRLCP